MGIGSACLVAGNSVAQPGKACVCGAYPPPCAGIWLHPHHLLGSRPLSQVSPVNRYGHIYQGSLPHRTSFNFSSRTILPGTSMAPYSPVIIHFWLFPTTLSSDFPLFLFFPRSFFVHLSLILHQRFMTFLWGGVTDPFVSLLISPSRK